MNAIYVDVETNETLTKARLENGFYSIINGERIPACKTFSLVNPATGEQLVSFHSDGAKQYLASLLKKIDDHADELSALLTAEQGGLLAQAEWEINLLTKEFGPALMQMKLHEKELEVQHIEHITKRYRPSDVGAAIGPWNLPVMLSFGRVLPALLAGDTVVLRPSPFTPLTVLRISDYIRELLPPGVFNVVTGGHDFWPWMTSHLGIDLITFTKSRNIGKRHSESAAGALEPVTVQPRGYDSRTVADADPETIALFGSSVLLPVNWRAGRWGLAGTLLEILSFQPGVMRTQVLVWSLARKASRSFPIFR